MNSRISTDPTKTTLPVRDVCPHGALDLARGQLPSRPTEPRSLVDPQHGRAGAVNVDRVVDPGHRDR
jgi:hypothetical protein